MEHSKPRAEFKVQNSENWEVNDSSRRFPKPCFHRWLSFVYRWKVESICGWSEVQMDHDEENRPMHGLYGALDAAVVVQRTIKRAELTAFL